MNKLSIVFVHSGISLPPICMVDSLAIAFQIAQTSQIVVLVNKIHILSLQQKLYERHRMLPDAIKWVSIESLGGGTYRLSSY